MHLLLLGAQLKVDASSIVAAVLGLLSGGSAVGGLVAKRSRDLGALYKGLYEGKSSEVKELTDRMTHLEAQVALYQSDFTAKLAEGITEAIVQSVESRLAK